MVSMSGTNSFYYFLKFLENKRKGHFNVKGLNPGVFFKSRLSLVVRVNVVLNRTVVDDSD